MYPTIVCTTRRRRLQQGLSVYLAIWTGLTLRDLWISQFIRDLVLDDIFSYTGSGLEVTTGACSLSYSEDTDSQ